ncbi:MAG: preprotein translocase subunit YajC [Clostridia bacterium]|nr:preprotein translocase subunit YajC [Clostridia bacterium]
MDYIETILMVVLLVGVFYMMYRSNKKQERETAEMRNSLEIGDEITTIGGIIGEIVRIKEETVTIETGKDRTKIRILRSAVRSVDVHAYEKRGDGKKPEPPVTEEPKKTRRLFGKNKVKNAENQTEQVESNNNAYVISDDANEAASVEEKAE